MRIADAFLAREADTKRAIHDLVREFGGSFSAEHGIGRLKVDELERYAPPVELELMRAVKRAFDPERHPQSRQDLSRRQRMTAGRLSGFAVSFCAWHEAGMMPALLRPEAWT